MGIKITAEQYQKLMLDQRSKGNITLQRDNKHSAPVPRGKDYRYNSIKAWHTVGETTYYARSKWEFLYSQYLQRAISCKEKNYKELLGKSVGGTDLVRDNRVPVSWKHEPRTFWFEHIKRGIRSYLPDFEVKYADGTVKYVEVKGYMDSKSKTKIKRFKKYYPEYELELIDKTWFQENKHLANIIPEWK